MQLSSSLEASASLILKWRSNLRLGTYLKRTEGERERGREEGSEIMVVFNPTAFGGQTGLTEFRFAALRDRPCYSSRSQTKYVNKALLILPYHISVKLGEHSEYTTLLLHVHLLFLGKRLYSLVLGTGHSFGAPDGPVGGCNLFVMPTHSCIRVTIRPFHFGAANNTSVRSIRITTSTTYQALFRVSVSCP